MRAQRGAACRQRGAVAVMFGVALPVIVGMLGLALELSVVFQRQGQLQQAADVAALAAAQQLDGSTEGVEKAYTRAQVAVGSRQVPGVGAINLGSAALSFAGAPAGSWLSYDAARAAPAGLRYVRADMAMLGPAYTTVPRLFAGLLGASGPATLDARAVAGPNGMRVLPLAICAPSSVPQAVRANGGGVDEMVLYGLRLGVGYNLLALNPAAGASSGEYFLIDPASPPGSTAVAASTDDAGVAPFMCTGKLAYSSLAGPLNLRRNAGFGLWQQLNSRFGDYGAGLACDPYSAPPDTNVREYRGSGASWMNSAPPQAAAASSTPAADKPLMTIADAAPPLPAVAPAQYGTLWAYGPARSSPTVAIGSNKWSTLYPAAPALAASGWPAAGPYLHAGHSTAPSILGRKERRLLHVPLLACPIAAGSQVQGSVLAVARFLLTARASATVVPGEFAGILSASEVAALATDVELLQ